MNNKNRLEEEFLNSQIYKTLSSSGSYVADKIAQGLNKAVHEIDEALSANIPDTENNKMPKNNKNAYNGKTYQYKYNPNTHSANNQQGAYRPAPPPVRHPKAPPKSKVPTTGAVKMVRGPKMARYFITGAAAVGYALNFPLYTANHFIIFGATLVGVFVVSSLLFKGKKIYVPVEPEPVIQKPEPEVKTGNPQVDKVVQDGKKYLRALKDANDAIPDDKLSESISRMEMASADIFRFITDNPEKASQISKFMNYYLPTTIKLLESYRRLSRQAVKGDNILGTMLEIEGMMHTVANAFEKQLDALFGQEAMDVSADITVFETILKQEGFLSDDQSELGRK